MLMTIKLICRVSWPAGCLPYSAPLLSFLLAVKIYHNLIFYLLSDHSLVKVISGYRPEHQVHGGVGVIHVRDVRQIFHRVSSVKSDCGRYGVSFAEKKLHIICTAESGLASAHWSGGVVSVA